MNTGCLTRLFHAQPVRIPRIGAGLAVLLWVTVCIAPAQEPDAKFSKITIPDGYTARHTVDVGGRMANTVGSDAMYNTLVNERSGPRVQGESFELHALPTNKHPLANDAHATGSGFGGDALNFAKLNVSKTKVYEFSGNFRRNRQYFDYNLLGNPNVPSGLKIPIGPSASPTSTLAWPQVTHSSVMFNTVRRMTDTSLTLFPVSKVTLRFGYSRNTMEGPSLSPSYSIMKYDALLRQYQRHSTDEYSGAVEWKPAQGTTVAYEQRVHFYKNDTSFTLDPNGFLVQEANGTPAYLGNWDATSNPYPASACNTTSMQTSGTILYPAQTTGGRPIIDPACAVVTSYSRTQPTRVTMPTETLRFQSTSLKNLRMNGRVSYSWATMNMPSYTENVWGLSGSVRNILYSGGHASGKREVVSADYGVIWQLTKSFSLSDQVSFMSAKQPGSSIIPAPATLSTPSTAGSQTINYTGTLTKGTGTLPHGIEGVMVYNYYGNEQVMNNLTASWDAGSRATFSLTYRYSNRNIGQGVPHKGSIPTVLEDPVNGTVAISQTGGIFNAAYRPAANWDLNGSIEVLYDDNAFTSVGARQLKHYRVHTKFRPKSWATISAGYNDQESHNNTNNNAEVVTGGENPDEGPLNHVDYARTASLSGVLTPSERYSVSFDYAFNKVYTATNICYTSGATSTLPGTATLTSSGAPDVCPGIYARGSTTQLVDWHARAFMDAPTNSGSVTLNINPAEKVRYGLGYRINSVNGSQFFTDARAVNGSLVSTYQTPYANVAWTVRPGLIWKAEYNFFGYGEGGPSGPKYCSTSTSTTATVVPCTSLPYPTGLTEASSGLTTPRNFHANNVVLGLHYEF